MCRRWQFLLHHRTDYLQRQLNGIDWFRWTPRCAHCAATPKKWALTTSKVVQLWHALENNWDRWWKLSKLYQTVRKKMEDICVKKKSFVLPRLHCIRENRALKLPQTNAYLSPALANLQPTNGPFRGPKIIWDCFSDRFMYLPVLIIDSHFLHSEYNGYCLSFLEPVTCCLNIPKFASDRRGL